MMCLYTSDEEIERLYFFRQDHKMILVVINLTKNMIRFSHDVRNECIRNGIRTLERMSELSVEEQFKLVREHFGL